MDLVLSIVTGKMKAMSACRLPWRPRVDFGVHLLPEAMSVLSSDGVLRIQLCAFDTMGEHIGSSSYRSGINDSQQPRDQRLNQRCDREPRAAAHTTGLAKKVGSLVGFAT